MRPLARDEIVDFETYGKLRDGYRRAVIAMKRERRLAVGPKVSLVFENRETLRFQVQEMLWVERIREPEGVQRELDAYNELMPAPAELSATLFIEITESSEIKRELDRLIGIDEHVALVLGEEPEPLVVPARFDPEQLADDRIAAVQYIRFRLSDAAAARLASGEGAARIRIAHPNYFEEAEIPAGVRRSLVADLGGDPDPLLHKNLVGAPSD